MPKRRITYWSKVLLAVEQRVKYRYYVLHHESRKATITDFGGDRCILRIVYDDGSHREIPLPNSQTGIDVVEVVIEWLNKNLPIPIPLPVDRLRNEGNK